jgi:hypothetical protein
MRTIQKLTELSRAPLTSRMILLQVLLLLILIVLGLRFGTHLLRGAMHPPKEIGDLQARVLELEEAVDQLREEQSRLRDASTPAERLLPRQVSRQSPPAEDA